MSENEQILENIAPTLESIFLRNLRFLRCFMIQNCYTSTDFVENSFRSVLVGVFQGLSTKEKLAVLEKGLHLDLKEDVFKYDAKLIDAWENLRESSTNIGKDQCEFANYLVNLIENYGCAFHYGCIRGFHLAQLCAREHLYLLRNDVKVIGEKDFLAKFEEVTQDDDFCFTKELYQINKLAWIDGFYAGFICSPEGEHQNDAAQLIIYGSSHKDDQYQHIIQSLYKILEERNYNL